MTLPHACRNDGGESADWTMGHPEKVKDWGYRAHYFVTTAAKALTSATSLGRSMFGSAKRA